MGGKTRAPAGIWRAFFVTACFCTAASGLFAQKNRPPPPLIQTGKADIADARAALEQMRRQGIAGNYFLEFQLRVMPRRGAERLIAGRMWGGRNESGALSRVSLELPGDATTTGVRTRRLLIQSGRQAAVWRWDASSGVNVLGVTSLFEPVVPQTELTAFDLQMPFLYWESHTYGGIVRFRGRPAHVLVLRPPAEFAARHPALTGVRVHLDTQFNALVQTELLGAKGEVTKTLSVVDLKKIGEQWIVRTIDLRDEATRNKTRFDVTAVALELEFSRTLFEPAQLDEDIRPPEAAELVRLEP